MGPPPVLAQIRNAGVQVEMFSAQPDLPSLNGNLQHLGKLLGDETKARELFAGYEQALVQQKTGLPTPGPRKRRRVCCC